MRAVMPKECVCDVSFPLNTTSDIFSFHSSLLVFAAAKAALCADLFHHHHYYRREKERKRSAGEQIKRAVIIRRLFRENERAERAATVRCFHFG